MHVKSSEMWWKTQHFWKLCSQLTSCEQCFLFVSKGTVGIWTHGYALCSPRYPRGFGYTLRVLAFLIKLLILRLEISWSYYQFLRTRCLLGLRPHELRRSLRSRCAYKALSYVITLRVCFERYRSTGLTFSVLRYRVGVDFCWWFWIDCVMQIFVVTLLWYSRPIYFFAASVMEYQMSRNMQFRTSTKFQYPFIT